ncbi:MAG: SEL1-like repeat protein, partial [Gammaproteobacteria bacterium]|nr:SEL1-like repeat protein [Gammaproteobacteria bacterium]
MSRKTVVMDTFFINKLVLGYLNMPRMLNKLMLLLPSLLWILALVSPVWAAEIDDAKRAYGAGEFENAAGLLRPLARDGSVEAQYLLGRMYEQGDGVARDEAEAKKLFKLAADQGHDNAGQRLALYENADSGEESVVLEWYLPAAEEGDMEAQYNLGFMYETGWGVGIDEKMAANWYKEASDLQHDMAQLRLGMMYVVGSGVSKDIDQGVELLRLAAENGNRVAEVLVQEVFDNDDARALDVNRIIRGLRRSVDDGEQQALNTLNTSLDRARRRVKQQRRDVAAAEPAVPRKEAKTVGNQEKPALASEKVSSAQFNIARAMDKGLGIPQNEPEMVKWYITAARQGNADAQFNLGILYVQGRGVSKDVQEGMRWFNAAASQGHELSKDYLQLWNDELDNATLGGSIAITWLKENARNWDLDSLYMMGQMFETGRGVNRNLNEARIWYRLAAEGGHKEARRQFDMVGRGNITTNTGSGSTISSSSKVLPTNQDTRTTGKAVATQFDWFWMILGFVGVAGLGFVIFILFRRSGGKMPTFAAPN